jgi:hypothetical protein
VCNVMCRIKDIKFVNIKDKNKRNIDVKMSYIVAFIHDKFTGYRKKKKVG